MAVYEVYSHPIVQRYRTSVCTKATLFQIICLLLTFIVPLLIAYRSYGFWMKERTYTEQPEVYYKHEFIMLVTMSDESYVLFSTYQNLNNLQRDNIRIPVMSSYEIDTYKDGYNDYLYVNLELPMSDTESVSQVQLLLFFDYTLQMYSTVNMQCMAYIQHSASAGSSFSTVGNLNFVQKYPISHSGSDNTYDVSVVDSTSILASSYDLSTVFNDYFSRNVSTVFQSSYPVWTTGRSPQNPFTIEATVYYPEQTITYNPGFWELMKWAWIQYIAVLLVFLILFDSIKTFVFYHQIISTIVESPIRKG